MTHKISKKRQLNVVTLITFGNILEWFDIYSYIYLSEVIAKVFFADDSAANNLLYTFGILGVCFLARPIGAAIFGRIGDHLGRKNSFILSIIFLSLPTFLLGCLPTYAQIGIWAPILLIALRILQSIPSAGETPGSICFLYEFSNPSNRRFMTSWTAVGNQIGGILAILESYFIDQSVSTEFLHTWGWRISFWTGALIGLFVLVLRTKLHETPTFSHLKHSHELDRESVSEVFINHLKPIGMGIAYGALNTAAYYFIATFLPMHFIKLIGMNDYSSFLFTLLIMAILTIPIPLFGMIGDKYNNRKLLVGSGICSILILLTMNYTLKTSSSLLNGFLWILLLFPTTCITSLLDYRYADLFPAEVRYSGIAFSYNFADGFIGGFTPAAILLLYHLTNSPTSFIWFIILCGVASTAAFMKVKD